MPVFNRNRHSGSSGVVAAYTIDQSIRFNYADAPVYLEKTPGGAGTSDKKMTLNVWIKLDDDTSRASSASYIISAGSGYDFLKWGDTPNGHMRVQFNNASSGAYTTTQHFRDPSAWGMLTFAVDTANATAGNRIRLYWNGVEITAFSTETDAALNYGMFFNAASLHVIGNTSAHEAGRQFHGYMAEFVYIDGQQLDPTSFGESDDNGNWVPIDPSGLTFGTNGFWLDFAVAPGTSNGAGTDVSGNGNHFSETGLAANDLTKDSPSDSADDDLGNYAVLNPLIKSGNTFSNGNLRHTNSSSTRNGAISTIPFVGKTYIECKMVSSTAGFESFGVCLESILTTDMNNNTIYDQAGVWMMDSSNLYKNGAGYSTYTAPSVGEFFMLAYDADTGELWMGENGTWFNSGDPDAGTGEVVTISTTEKVFAIVSSKSNSVQEINFGQQAMNHDVNVGEFTKNLHTGRLAAPTITDPSKYFQVDTFTGTGAELARTLTDAEGGAVKPDLVWIRDRDSGVEHVWTDSARGATIELSSNDSGANETVAQGLKSFDTSGYTLGTDASYNASSSLNVAWCWNTQGGAGSSNTAGSINTTTTSVGTTQGFSISTYTGNDTAGATVGHGLGVVPDMFIVKTTNAADPWSVYHGSNTSAPETDFLYLQENEATADSLTRWNDTAPTSSVISIHSDSSVNSSARNYVLYAWAGVEGYSKFSSFEGNADADGTFVYCGFRPAWILIKKIDAVGGWGIWDAKRSGINGTNAYMDANGTVAESTDQPIDILSNGFKPRISTNPNPAQTMIFAAFAEFPFGGDGVSQARAR
jgi:hypothetical protein